MKSTKKLVLAALFVALYIVFTKLFSFTILGIERVSLEFLAASLCGLLLGPLWSVPALIAADIIGAFLLPAGPYFPGFTLSAALMGLLYGLILYNKPVTVKRTALAVATVTVFISLGLGPVWLKIMYNKGYLGMMAVKVPVELVLIPIKTAIVYWVAKALKRTKMFQ